MNVTSQSIVLLPRHDAVAQAAAFAVALLNQIIAAAPMPPVAAAAAATAAGSCARVRSMLRATPVMAVVSFRSGIMGTMLVTGVAIGSGGARRGDSRRDT